MSDVTPAGFNFKKGDEANYNLNMSIIKGSMKMLVMDIVADGVWIQQLVDLGFAGKQDMQQLIDPNTGEIKKLIVNGKEQAPPKTGDVEVIDSKEDTVTVPAGTFTCLYIKAKVTQDGKASEAQQWVNPKEVPVFGMVKMITQSQLGPVTVELLSFKRM
ncbi:MAG: hypothetical protein KF681_12425 [Bdellovibrionaceae bacterium]|nr:hypothetical protein [Pseudobdellovibrionaceae bacterium]